MTASNGRPELAAHEVQQEGEGQDAEARRREVIRLGQLSPTDASGIAGLVGALGDTDWRVRKEAAALLGQRAGPPALIERLVDAVVQGENVGLRNSALEALAKHGGTVADALLRRLPLVDVAAKKFIVEGLGNTGAVGAVPALVDAVHQPDANTAAAAVEALSRIGGREAELALRGLLRSADPFQRLAALDALTRLSSEVPYDELAPLMGDRMTQRVALELLGRTGRVEALDPLVEALEDRSLTVAGSGAVGLVRLFDASPELTRAVSARARQLTPRARESLRLLVVEGALAVRQAAAHLAILGQDPGILEVALGLASEGALPSEALQAFLHWGPSAIEPLLEVHGQTSGLVSGLSLELACDLLQHADAAGAAPSEQLTRAVRASLSAALDAHDEAVRRAAVRSLTACPEEGDAARLVTMLQAAGEELATAVGVALRHLLAVHPAAVGRALQGISFDWPGAAVVCDIIADVDDAQRLEGLRAAQASASPVVRRAAVLALAKVHHDDSAECVRLSLSDDDVNVRVAAAEALGVLGRVLGADSLRGALRVALEADTPAVVAAAARALALAGDTRSVPVLREKLQSERPGVALSALEALRVLQAPLDDALADLARHSDEEVVKQALSLSLRGDPETALRVAGEALRHVAWHVRAVAVNALADVPGGVDVLRAHADAETDPHVRRALDQHLTPNRVEEG
ncbi:MAG: HEAT repeat domain-containing protein [Sandaracinaceae bacterium]|nr:HEAT repeat domain-containing protein [Myxococcales bacterium]MCB9661608.1 HEAT repeat domain-containing protein [Sandaracinaceae bacterium]